MHVDRERPINCSLESEEATKP